MPVQQVQGTMASKGRFATSGYVRVTYRNASGHTFEARVLGLGSDQVTYPGSLKLQIREGAANVTKDNVPRATARTDTSVYFWRQNW